MERMWALEMWAGMGVVVRVSVEVLRTGREVSCCLILDVIRAYMTC
jgi:hypothetical protein